MGGSSGRESGATARREVSTILRLDSAFEPGPPARFAALVAEVRRAEQTAQVASVSKTKESLREAPATVVVITGEEIERRGYHDLEEVFHDLPGFDISRSNGEVYSTFYQRGFRSNTNDHNLLLLDSVPSSFDLKAAFTYVLSAQWKLQLAGDNLFNAVISDPGITDAGALFAESLPQPGRTFYLRLITGLPSS